MSESKEGKNYKVIRLKFMAWLTTVDEDREIATQRQFAMEHGVAEERLSRWKHDPAFVAQLNELVDKHLADEFAPAANALKRNALRGSFNHLKLYFEMIDKYKDTSKVEGDLHVTIDYSDQRNTSDPA